MGKNTKLSENGEIYTAGKNFTLPPAVTALTNSNSGDMNLARFRNCNWWYDQCPDLLCHLFVLMGFSFIARVFKFLSVVREIV